jgi:S1-C subfamily serine protease
MPKVALYSRSVRPPGPRAPAAPPGGERQSSAGEPAAVPVPAKAVSPRHSRLRGFLARHDRPLWALAGVLFVLAIVFGRDALAPPPARPLTQDDIDQAVLHTLDTKEIPTAASKAYEAVRRSVVRVRGIGHKHEPGKKGAKRGAGKPSDDMVEGIGSGVVIVDTGIILTNLHVVSGAEQIEVEFDDGLESEATVIGVRPEHDLAVLQAKKLPDDLPAAALRSTADLAPGDEVIAVGFPFGIGPSVSRGVISGLHRDYYSPKGKRVLTNLIQFDAAANPGNSGGPLVTASGEVVGIVTGILNPTEQRVFIGIGFAVPIENAAAAVGLSPF